MTKALSAVVGKKVSLQALNKMGGSYRVEVVPIKLLFPNPTQPRKIFTEENIQGKMDSMSEVGLIEPLIVTPRGKKYMIVSGECRWTAATRLKWEKIAVRILELNDDEVRVLSMVANFSPTEMTEIEVANGIMDLLKMNHSVFEVSKWLGKSQVWVYGKLKYLKLHPQIMEMLVKREISPAIGTEISAFEKKDQPKIFTYLDKFLKLNPKKKFSNQELHIEVVRIAESLCLVRRIPSRGPSLSMSHVELVISELTHKTRKYEKLLEKFASLGEEKLKTLPHETLFNLYSVSKSAQGALGLILKQLQKYAT